MNAYPYTGWYLTAGLMPKEATFVRPRYGGGWDDNGKVIIRHDEIYASREAALAEADKRIAKSETTLAKGRASLDKKIATVARARATTP